MREDYLIAIANLVNGSLLEYKDRSRVSEYEKTVDDYVNSLEQENQKYKEVIDKTREYVEKHLTDKGRFLMLNEWQVPDLLEILKEVEQ